MNGTAKRRILRAKLRQDLHPLYLRKSKRPHKPMTAEGLADQVARARAAMMEAMTQNIHGCEGIPLKWSREQSSAVVERGLKSLS